MTPRKRSHRAPASRISAEDIPSLWDEILKLELSARNLVTTVPGRPRLHDWPLIWQLRLVPPWLVPVSLIPQCQLRLNQTVKDSLHHAWLNSYAISFKKICAALSSYPMSLRTRVLSRSQYRPRRRHQSQLLYLLFQSPLLAQLPFMTVRSPSRTNGQHAFSPAC